MNWHPDSATLQMYCQGEVSDQVIRKIERHIIDCGLCSRFIADEVRKTIEGSSAKIGTP
jgi:hypothetical protein